MARNDDDNLFLVIGLGIAAAVAALVGYVVVFSRRPKLVFVPSTAARGTTTKMIGSGFAPNSATTVSVLSISRPFVTTDSSGGFTNSVLVPTNSLVGSFQYTVTDATGASATATLTVT